MSTAVCHGCGRYSQGQYCPRCSARLMYPGVLGPDAGTSAGAAMTPPTLAAIRERDREVDDLFDNLPQAAQDRRWLLAELDRVEGERAKLVEVLRHIDGLLSESHIWGNGASPARCALVRDEINRALGTSGAAKRADNEGETR